jgi:hypothetical protein
MPAHHVRIAVDPIVCQVPMLTEAADLAWERRPAARALDAQESWRLLDAWLARLAGFEPATGCLEDMPWLCRSVSHLGFASSRGQRDTPTARLVGVSRWCQLSGAHAPQCELSAARSLAVAGAGQRPVAVGRSRSRPMTLLYSCAVRQLGLTIMGLAGTADQEIGPSLSARVRKPSSCRSRSRC